MYASKVKKIFTASSGSKTVDVLSDCGDTAKEILIQVDSGHLTSLKGRIHPCFEEVIPGMFHVAEIPGEDEDETYELTGNELLVTVPSTKAELASGLPAGVFEVLEPEIYRELTFTAEEAATVSIVMLY